jgi:site-specific recombinase XerD
METTLQFHRNSTVWHVDGRIAPYLDIFKAHLIKRGYAAGTVGTYMACVAHFARWLGRSGLDVARIDEATVRRFLDVHLPNCHCAKPVCRVYTDSRAALGHLLVVLRINAAIAEPPLGILPVDVELRRFEEHMNDVRGLAPKTRSHYLRTIGRLLLEQFADHPVTIATIKPEDIRRFITSQGALCSTPTSIGAIISALRGYLRFRASCGDHVHHLVGVVNYPANWQLASLPKTLSGAEVDRLLGVLGQDGQSARRNDAIVRCALDLGLRSSEVAKLGLDDIDWRASTITLRETKSRREDILPLPEATGRAIADYLQFERPQTSNRAVFVRHIAPRDQPIGPDCVRKVIRQAYERAGLPYTRSHLLRHTMASRLLEGGSSLKEVADVLRHRSLNTTLIYAKLDSRNLRGVALSWPGSIS